MQDSFEDLLSQLREGKRESLVYKGANRHWPEMPTILQREFDHFWWNSPTPKSRNFEHEFDKDEPRATIATENGDWFSILIGDHGLLGFPIILNGKETIPIYSLQKLKKGLPKLLKKYEPYFKKFFELVKNKRNGCLKLSYETGIWDPVDFDGYLSFSYYLMMVEKGINVMEILELQRDGLTLIDTIPRHAKRIKATYGPPIDFTQIYPSQKNKQPTQIK